MITTHLHNIHSAADAAIIDELRNEADAIGYYHLPYQDTAYVDEFLATVDAANITDIVVVGIGGSSLGIRAIYHFIKASRNLSKKMYFMDSTDPLAITNILDKISINNTHFIVISKSGTTIETIATYKYLLNIVQKHQFSFITDKGSPLDRYASNNGQIVTYMQPNIGGRFSALSTVGTLPLALVGINHQMVLQGAKNISEQFFAGSMPDLITKAYFYAKNHSTYNINTLFSYSDSLTYFNAWFVQLWGESLGKKKNNSVLNVGPTPIGLIGPKDQHSFLQLLADGTRDKTITFIIIQNTANTLSVPNINLEHLEKLNMLNGTKFADLINHQAYSTLEALKQYKRIPIDEIRLHAQDEQTIGSLLFYYQLLTSIVGKLLDVNTYNQPGVELGKQILNTKLQQL